MTFLFAGTGSDWQACPSGTYSNTAGLYNETQCLPCDAGKYCMGEHLTATTGDCAAGEMFCLCFENVVLMFIIAMVLDAWKRADVSQTNMSNFPE